MGLFFYTKKGSIISTVDLPTTEIIEPFFIYWLVFAQPLFQFNLLIFSQTCTKIVEDNLSFTKKNIIIYKKILLYIL